MVFVSFSSSVLSPLRISIEPPWETRRIKSWIGRLAVAQKESTETLKSFRICVWIADFLERLNHCSIKRYPITRCPSIERRRLNSCRRYAFVPTNSFFIVGYFHVEPRLLDKHDKIYKVWKLVVETVLYTILEGNICTSGVCNERTKHIGRAH